MKFGVIIPDRNDRPKFLANCMRMIQAQTIKPEIVLLVNDPQPEHIQPHQKDITWRYKKGYNELRNKGLDCIFFVENDDWYCPYYFEEMLKAWEKHNRPELLGHTYTIYYHIGIRRWRTFDHFQRSSAMNTLIKPDLNFPWCPDTEPYTDTWLWMRAGLKGITFRPGNLICMGIKHGDGLTGGEFHSNRFDTFKYSDADFDYLRTNLDTESFNFYSTYYENNPFTPIQG